MNLGSPSVEAPLLLQWGVVTLSNVQNEDQMQ